MLNNNEQTSPDDTMGRTLGLFTANSSTAQNKLAKKMFNQTAESKTIKETLNTDSNNDKSSFPALNTVKSQDEFNALNQQFHQYQQYISGGKRIKDLAEKGNSEEKTRNANNITVNSANQNQSSQHKKTEEFLMKNQRLKLIQTMKKRSSRKAQNIATHHEPLPPYTHDYVLNYDSHPTTSRQSRKMKIQSQQIEETRPEETQTPLYKDLAQIINSPAESSYQKKPKSKKKSEKFTQTGEHEQILDLKEFNLKKKLDNLAKESDKKEIAIENKLMGKSSFTLGERIDLNSEKIKIYEDALTKLVNDVFDHTNQFFPDRLNTHVKTQFQRYISGLKDVEERILRACKEHYLYTLEEFKNFKNKVKRLTDDLQKTHLELVKEKQDNLDLVYADKKAASNKAIELLNSLNSLLQSESISKTELNFGKRQQMDDKNINNLSFKLNSIAGDIIQELDTIDKENDPVQRKIKKAQLLMSLQPSTAGSSLTEVHNVFVVMNKHSAGTPQQFMDEFLHSDDPQQQQIISDMESSIRNKFVNIQRDTAKKILNRFCKPPETKNREVQTDDDFVKQKLEIKRLKVKKQKGEIKELSTKLVNLEEEHQAKTIELSKIKRNLEDLEYKFTDLKGKYEIAATNEYMYKKKYSEVEDRVKLLEEDLEDLDIKRRQAEVTLKKKVEEVQGQMKKISELERKNEVLERTYKEQEEMMNTYVQQMNQKLKEKEEENKELEKQVKNREEQMKLLCRSPTSSFYDSDVSYSDGYDPNDPEAVRRHKEKQKRRYEEKSRRQGGGGNDGDDEDSMYNSTYGNVKGAYGSRQTDYDKYGSKHNQRRNKFKGRKGSDIGEDGEYSDSENEERKDGERDENSPKGKKGGRRGKKGKKGLRGDASEFDITDPRHPHFGKTINFSGDEGSPTRDLLNQDQMRDQSQWGASKLSNQKRGPGGKFTAQDTLSQNQSNSPNKQNQTFYSNQRFNFMQPLNKKDKQAQYEAEWREHQKVHDKCGPNCKWMQRMGRVFVKKHNRQELKLKKQNVELDDN